MRIIDMANNWALGTLGTYSSKIKALKRFEHTFGVSILRTPVLTAPPNHEVIPLMWLQEQHSLRSAPKARDPNAVTTVTFGTVRAFRSAASQHLAWQHIVSRPHTAFLDHRRRLIDTPVRATDAFACTAFTGGLSARLGNETRPSTALLDRHVRELDRDLNEKFLHATTPVLRRLYARAGLGNLQFYLAWLRSAEGLTTRWSRYEVTQPADGPLHDLPPGVGVIKLDMEPETKSNRTSTANVIMAYQTLSGYSPGKWFHRLRQEIDPDNYWTDDHRLVFVHDDGIPWTSRYFRTTFLYPSLHAQRLAGDPFLRAFDGSPGNSIEDKYWSLNCYRRGGRSHVSKSRTGAYKKATKAQIYEHGRWRLNRSSEPVDVMYREWTLRDRIKITLYCM